VLRDDLPPAKVAARGRYSPAFLAAIDAGLAVRPERRPQTAAEFREWLERPEAAEPDIELPGDEAGGGVDLALEPEAPPPPAPAAAAKAPSRLPWIAGGIVAVLALGLLAWGLAGSR
jgi:hypothetical protein